jgi:YgiT-type zinc finger domain-containing protein
MLRYDVPSPYFPCSCDSTHRHCPLCGGEKQPGTTTFAVDLEFGVVVVREVPAFVCTQCGDASIDDLMAGKLESLVAKARRKQALVEVTQWRQEA